MKQVYVKEWLEDMPKLIYDLKFKYDFYWDGWYHNMSKPLPEYINPDKHHKKMIVYKSDDGGLFMVLYRKADQVLYYSDAYVKDKTESRLWYSRKKLNKFYKKAEDERLYAIIEAAEAGCC